jgi:hypothetical protein
MMLSVTMQSVFIVMLIAVMLNVVTLTVVEPK